MTPKLPESGAKILTLKSTFYVGRKKMAASVITGVRTQRGELILLGQEYR